MSPKKLQNSFREFCKTNKFEINKRQLETVQLLEKFVYPLNNVFNFFFKKDSKLCFYLYGGVGVGKTMIVDYVYDNLKLKKNRQHFNQFMINFHDFCHKKKENSVKEYVNELKKKYEIIYLDEFQVTNIVDAMILGKLFELIFLANIKIIITTNIKPDNLYKEGLQREQFLPFINLIKKKSIQNELVLESDYRLKINDIDQRIFFPLNEKTLFNLNQSFRILTKNFKKEEKIIKTKGRSFTIPNYYCGITRLDFKDLCDQNLGSEDYLNLAKVCKHLFIENIPQFNETNSNQQLRLITLIDILYDRKVNLTVSINSNISNITSSKKHLEIFKRTISRLHEMTLSNNSQSRL